MGRITGTLPLPTSREAAGIAQRDSPDIRRTWVQSLISPINSCVTSAELLYLSELHLTHE